MQHPALAEAGRQSKEYFDEVEARKYFVEPHIPGVRASSSAGAGKRVLEVGCGIGTDTINFARAGAELTAVDLSGESLRIAEQRAEVMGVADRIRFVEANAEELSSFAAGEPFDLVYSFGVIHHTPHPERVLARDARSSPTPGGTLKLMVYHRRSWKVFWIVMTQEHGPLLERGGAHRRSTPRRSSAAPSRSRTRPPSEGARSSSAQGSASREVVVDHVFPYRIRDYVEYRYVKVPYFRFMPDRAFRWLRADVRLAPVRDRDLRTVGGMSEGLKRLSVTVDPLQARTDPRRLIAFGVVRR